MAEARVERRLAAILAADVAGYSRLMGQDEEGTLAALNACRMEVALPKITEHRGRVVKTTGDGVLVEFASAVDATRCAAEIQDALAARNATISSDRRIELRIGINVGDVIVQQSDIFGDGVNVAARLEALAEPGGICLSEDAYRQVRDKLAILFEDAGEQQLKNIGRPVHVYRVKSGKDGETQPPPSPLALPDRPSIAVLPFQNMSRDSEQDYFCDGMVEDIITGLSRIKWLFVIARNSTFTYKGRAVDVKQVGRELGVRYVLEGSVRKAADRVRITGQLIDAATGTHVWAERYDRRLEDIFALQDEMTSNVVGAIEPNIRHAEIDRVRRERRESLNAYDLLLRALPDVYAAMPKEALKALQMLDRALTMEPDYALAHAYAAWCYEIRFLRAGENPDDRGAAIRHAYSAIAKGPDDATAMALSGFVIAHVAHDMQTARKAFEQALTISPSSFIAFAFGANAFGWKGDAERAIEWGERAIRISPFDHLLYVPNHAIAMGNFLLGRYDQALEAARRAIQSKPDLSIPHQILAAAFAASGRLDEARLAASRALTLQPDFSTRAFCTAIGMPVLLAEPFAAALLASGMPQ